MKKDFRKVFIHEFEIIPCKVLNVISKEKQSKNFSINLR